MSEFKFACPVCGQHIRCDSTQSGMVMECPTCFQKITAPNAPSSDDPKFILTGIKVGERPVIQTPELTPVTHAPKTISGTLVVLIIFAFLGTVAAFIYRGTIFKSLFASHDKTVLSITNNSSPAAPAKTAVVAPPASDTNWVLDLDAAVIPDATATGRIHGENFICGRTTLEGGTLTLRAAKGTSETGLSIYLHANQGEDLAGQVVNVPTNFPNAPRVRLRWKDEQAQSKTETLREGYALRVEFGELNGKFLAGKIYLATPDDLKSYIAGNFNAEIRPPKPAQ